ncbi:hypothetical protein BT69DRAFT_1228244 [Atractiella rhizophila]|nr:hypothetical protein BT69DRAFT_1228244 [Atractiella rhizophila]
MERYRKQAAAIEKCLGKGKFDTELQARRVRALGSFYNLLKSGQRGRVEASKYAASATRFGEVYGARCIRMWARHYEETGELPVSNRGRHVKTYSLLNDEKLCADMRAWLHEQKWNMDPTKIRNYTLSTLIPQENHKYVQMELEQQMPKGLKHYLEISVFPHIQYKPGKRGIALSTACRWLKREGFKWTNYKKGLYIELHHSWCLDGQSKLRKKGAGRGIHRSDFICSTYGWLEDAGEQLEYGTAHEGYWDAEKLIEQVEKKFIPVFERLHPGQTALVVFDDSTGHGAMASDALNAKNMNLGPGGKPVMRDGWWSKDGIKVPQPMMDVQGVPKGMRAVLQERANCDYTFEGLRRTVPEALKSIKLSTIRKFEHRSHRWIRAYKEGKNVIDAGYQVKEHASHRRIPEARASTGDISFI